DVNVSDSAGSVVYGAGANDLTTTQAQRVLLGHETDGTLSHLVTAEAVLRAWFTALHAPGIARTTLRVEPHAGVLVGAATAKARFDTLPVDPVDAGVADTGAGERFQIRDHDTALLVASDFAFARLGIGGRRPRVELLNGVGAAGITPRAARLLVPAGADV